jgi:glycosyltransferase involved in cell wall biosynthesis
VFDLQYGGEGRFATLLGNWLATEGCEVTMMGAAFASIKSIHLSKSNVQRGQVSTKETKKEGTKKMRVIYPPYPIYLLSRLFMSLLWAVKILLVNKKFPITIIHAQDTGYSGLAAVVSGKLLGIPVIINSHGIRHQSLESVIRGRLRNVLLKVERSLDIFTIKNANGVLVVNSAIRRYYSDFIKANTRLDVTPAPIKLKNFEFSEANKELIRKEIGIDKDARVIGFVGRFSPEKNLLTLLTSFANIVQDRPTMKLVLVGTGPIENELKECVNNRRIGDNVIFCGIRYDIGRVLAGFDIFVLPSYTEGLSTALLEAMASGRAILCSDIPANRELVSQNQEALLVNPYDAKELENAIRLLSNDELLRIKIGNNAKTKASQYDEDIVFPRILKYYKMFVA